MKDDSATPPPTTEVAEAPSKNLGDRSSCSGTVAEEAAPSTEEQVGATDGQGNHAIIGDIKHDSATPPPTTEVTEAPSKNLGDHGSSSGAATGEDEKREQVSY